MARVDQPYWVNFHAHDEDSGDSRSYLMQVFGEGEQDEDETDPEQLTGEVHVFDADNDAARAAGLSEGVNIRRSIGRGGPGKNVSWSPIS